MVRGRIGCNGCLGGHGGSDVGSGVGTWCLVVGRWRCIVEVIVVLVAMAGDGGV